MELHFEKLSKILNNLSKAPTRRYRNSTLIAKLHEAKQVYNAAIIEIELYKESEQLQLLKNLRYLYGEAYTKLTARLDNNIEPLSFKNLVNVILTINKLYRKVKMANTLDLSLAIRVVGKYDGDAAELENWLNDVTVLRAGQPTVDEAVFVQFMNNRLTGAARGELTGIATIIEARNTLRSRFGIKLTPVAVTAELRGLKQKGKSLVDFGNEIEKVAARLAAAWVSKQPQLFPTEAATRPIVEPIAVEAFINGLKDQSKVLQMRSRNPETLTKALSDALEIHAQPMPEEVMWTYASYSNPGFRGRGRGKRNKNRGNRGYQNNQNRNYEQQNGNQQGYNNQQQQGYNSNRGHRGNRGYQHNRGGGNRGVANVVSNQILRKLK
ncbi:uncharacterized protein LOC120414083 [Culex pipiens pallens]|uniref:uncharacterized protein LOC120414083 n=1 Tax=Culex pipiens pallens TaxID=42434 RepID=UPI001953E2DC|nr:uncharacterized protein LOC120414083 [Culex pipiens pallens]